MSIRGRTRCSSAIGFWCPLPSGRDHFLLRHRHCIQERLHWGFAEAPTSLMWPCLIALPATTPGPTPTAVISARCSPASLVRAALAAGHASPATHDLRLWNVEAL